MIVVVVIVAVLRKRRAAEADYCGRYQNESNAHDPPNRTRSRLYVDDNRSKYVVAVIPGPKAIQKKRHEHVN